MVWFQTSWFTYQGRKAKNYFTTRDLLIGAMPHVKLIENCHVPRRLSPDENWRAKEGGKEKRGETALNLSSLPFRMVPCTLSPVTRLSRSHLFETMRKTKRLRRRLDRGDTRLYMPLNVKSMAFLLQFFESFRGKINKKYSTGNEEWIKSETATITSDYVVSWAFHKLPCRQYKCTPKRRTIVLFLLSNYFKATLE